MKRVYNLFTIFLEKALDTKAEMVYTKTVPKVERMRTKVPKVERCGCRGAVHLSEFEKMLSRSIVSCVGRYFGPIRLKSGTKGEEYGKAEKGKRIGALAGQRTCRLYDRLARSAYRKAKGADCGI